MTLNKRFLRSIESALLDLADSDPGIGTASIDFQYLERNTMKKNFILILALCIAHLSHAANEVTLESPSFAYTSVQVGMHQYQSTGTVSFGVTPFPGVTLRRIRVAPRLAGRNLIFPDAKTSGDYQHTGTIRNGVRATSQNTGCIVTVWWQAGRRSGQTSFTIR